MERSDVLGGSCVFWDDKKKEGHHQKLHDQSENGSNAANYANDRTEHYPAEKVYHVHFNHFDNHSKNFTDDDFPICKWCYKVFYCWNFSV